MEEVKILQILQSSQHVIRYNALISDTNMVYLLFEFAQGKTSSISYLLESHYLALIVGNASRHYF